MPRPSLRIVLVAMVFGSACGNSGSKSNPFTYPPTWQTPTDAGGDGSAPVIPGTDAGTPITPFPWLDAGSPIIPGTGSDGGNGALEDGAVAMDGSQIVVPDTDGGDRDAGTLGSDAGTGGGTAHDVACMDNLTKTGTDSLCASCACGRCNQAASACGPDAKCAAAVACMHDNGCSGVACYCGTDPLGCALTISGPCKAPFEAAAGKTGQSAIQAALGDGKSSLGKAQAVVTCTHDQKKCDVACAPNSTTCGFNDLSCEQRYCTEDTALEAQRAASASQAATPAITQVSINGQNVWSSGQSTAPALAPGDRVVLTGSGFGAGTNVDFSKLLVGNVRILETDLTMYEQTLDISKQVASELTTVRSNWARDILSWSDTRIEFNVPAHVTRGPILVQVQKRTGANLSYVYPGEKHAVVDPQTIRITDTSFKHRCDVVSDVSEPVASNAVPVTVNNPGLPDLVKKGRGIFWSYDYNLGLTHSIRGLDWTAILGKKTTDPITKLTADPLTLFGAYPTVAGEVPDEAISDVYFKPYPQKDPVPGYLLVLSSQKTEGNTSGTGYAGYRYAEATNPYTGDGKWIGFNCGSCHGYRISWESAPGVTTTKIIPGMPNPRWSMKWSLLGNFKGVTGSEPGPIWDPSSKTVDKTALLYAMPHGQGEHDLIRFHGEGSLTDNDYGFSPISIPNVTYYLPIRRSLSHTEAYVGFEGSYIHAQEPDGSLGSMDADSLKALTAYMGQLDGNDDQLRAVGVYRWLKYKGQHALYEDDSEGTFVQKGPRAYPDVAARLDHGADLFAQNCASCHQDNVGQFTNERMIPLHEVGRFFEPTIYHREAQSIRVTFLRNLYWVQHRGLLSDGHVRNLEELVHPDRCTEGSDLYKRYYTLHQPTASLPAAGPDFPTLLPQENPRGDVFRVLRGTDNSSTSVARNTFIERFRYFTRVAGDDGHYYWDYQKMRKEYGPWELGSGTPIGWPAAPHPWCTQSADEVDDLVLYLVSL